MKSAYEAEAKLRLGALRFKFDSAEDLILICFDICGKIN